jgi:Sigma-70, region 4
MLGRRSWLGLALVGTTFWVGGLPASAQSPVPSLPAPTVTPPPVALPPAPSLPISPPAVATPSAPIPAVATPSVSTAPSVSAPSVSAPSVSAPSVTGPSTPAVSAPTVTERASSTQATPARSTAATRAAAAPGASAASRAVAAPPARATPARSRAAATGRRHAAAAAVRKRDRALRRAVLRFQGCLAHVPRAERRVLTLRAGVGIGRTRSRAAVARITGLRRARVAQLERRGLEHLRALGRSRACAVPAPSAGTAAAGAPAVAPQSGDGATPRGGGRGQVLAERHSGGDRQRESEGSKAGISLGRPSAPDVGSSSFDLTILLVPLALLAFGFVLVREVRRTS